MFSEQMVVCSDKPFPLRNGRPPSDGYIISPGLGVGKLERSAEVVVVLGVETGLLWVISKQTKENHGHFMNSPSPNGTFPPYSGLNV